jgi:hypothetical protein
MATAALTVRDATITYTPPGGAQVVHQLAIPLLQIEPVDRMERHDWWAADLDNREVVTVGAGVYEIMATVRFENEPANLKALLRTALRDDVTLFYTLGSTIYPLRLVAVLGASGADETPLAPDRDRYGFGEWECRLHLRRTDGSTLDSLFS